MALFGKYPILIFRGIPFTLSSHLGIIPHPIQDTGSKQTETLLNEIIYTSATIDYELNLDLSKTNSNSKWALFLFRSFAQQLNYYTNFAKRSLGDTERTAKNELSYLDTKLNKRLDLIENTVSYISNDVVFFDGLYKGFSIGPAEIEGFFSVTLKIQKPPLQRDKTLDDALDSLDNKNAQIARKADYVTTAGS